MDGCTVPAKRPATASGAGLAMKRGAFVAVRRLGAALAILAVLGFFAPAAADVLVSNLDRTDEGSRLPLRGVKQAQGFTTGSNGTGYTLSSIDLILPMNEGLRGEVTVQLATGLKAGGKSYTVVATLTNPSSYPDRGPNRFTAPSGTVLDANTKYWVVAAAANPKRPLHLPPLTPIGVGWTSDSGETRKFGWSVDDNRLWMGPSGRWLSPSSIPSAGIHPGPVELRVNGTERASSDPVLTMSDGSAVTEGTAASFTVTSDRAPSDPLTVNLTVSEPAGSDYVASSDEGSKTMTIPANATTATYLVTTQADGVVEPHGSVAVRLATGTGYTVGTNSAASVAVHEATPPPLPATGLTASYSSATAVGLAWTLPTQLAGVTVSGHEVQQQSAGSWTTVASLGADATSHTVTGLTNGTSYTFRVRVAGNHGSADSETVSLTALSPPKPATGLTFSNVTADTVDLSWTLPEQGAGVVVSRMEVHGVRNRPDTIHRQEFTDDQWGRALGLDTTSITWGVYHGGIVHDFRVRLFTNTGITDSEVASWSSPLAQPNPPTDLSFSNVTATSVDLSWTLPEQGEGVVVSAVKVLWEEDERASSYYYDWNSETLTGDAVSHTVTGLKAGTDYVFRVQVVANSGNGTSREENKYTLHGVSGLAVVSDAGADDTYALGEEIQIRVSFTSSVHVDTAGGVPRLKIKMDPALGEKWVAYESGDGTSELTFVHTVVEPDISTQGIAVLADTLEANGGTILKYWNAHADLSHDGLGHDAAHKVDWRLSPDEPDTPPTEAVPGVEVVSDPGADATYAFRDTIRIRVRFDEAMDVTGAPRLKIALRDGASWQRWGDYEGGSGTDSLTFAYIVAEYDSTAVGTAVLANTLDLNGGTIRSAATGTDADLSHDGLDKDPAHQVNWFHSAAAAEVTSIPADGESYGTGETVRIKVTFREAVDVTGAPRQAIDLVPFRAGGNAWAAYEGGSGTSSLTFVYTVAESDTSRGGLGVSNLLELNGGTIRWTATQADVPVAHLDGKAGVLHHGVYQTRVDRVVDPGVHAAYVDSRPASGDTYDVGETIRLMVSFTEEVDVTGMPRLKIKMDPEGAEKWADYEGIPGSWRTNQEFRTFTYTVAEPDISTQGIAVLANSLELNGGTIKAQATGTDVDLAHDGEDHDPAHKVNWQLSPPTPAGLSIVSLPASGDTYGFGETIRVMMGFNEDVLVAGTPRLKIKMDPDYGEKWATYEGAATGSLLYFAYTVVEPNISTQGIAVLADTLEANGGLIWSAGPGGVIADLSQHVGQGHDPAHKVDWTTVTPVSNTPATGELTITGTAQVGETLTASTVDLYDADGLAGARLAYQWMSNDGTADSDIAGAIGEIYTLAAADAGRTIKVRGSFTDDEGNGETLTSAATAAVALPRPPTVTGVEVISDAGSDDTYGLGESIRVRVAFSEAVEVEGAPRLKIDFDPAPWGGKWAAYESGGGTSELTFAYEVVQPNESTEGIAVVVNTLEANGGAFRSAATQADAHLSHAGLDHDAAHKVDWRVTQAAAEVASVTGIEVVSDAGGDDTYGLGESIRVRVAFSEAVEVEGAPRLKIDFDPAPWGGKWAAYESGGGTSELTFAYEVVQPNVSTEGIAVVVNTLEVNGGAIRTAATQADAHLSHARLGHDPTHKVDWTVSPVSNGAATGAPTITGTAQVGETLTASTADIADTDGLTGVTFAYQWVSIAGTTDTDIAGATASTYTLADADVGRAIKVRVSFTDDGGNAETLDGAATASVAPRPNRPATGAPAITGTAQVGETLTASTADIADADGLTGATFAYQWVSIAGTTDTDIAGATASTYTLADAEEDRTVKVRVSFTDDAGHGETRTSAATASVAPRPNRPATGVPMITGTAQVGETLTASTADIADADGLTGATFAYQWVSIAGTADSDIANATASTYTLAIADVGRTIKVRVSFTDDAGHAEVLTSARTGKVLPRPLTASFHGMPAEHDGKKLFSFEIRFSEEFQGLRLTTFKAGGLRVTDGRLIDAKRTVQGQNRSLTVRVRPTSFEDVTIALPATADCAAATAICAKDGRKLSNAVSATVQGPAVLSVADARVKEGVDAAVVFAVTLSRAASDTVKVDYATRDNTATAGEDYTPTRGTLTFAAGELEKAVSVSILDDAVDEGEETFTLKLMNARGAAIGDGEATGTIENSDHMPKAWTARFGRTVAAHVVDAVQARLEGASNSYLELGGQRLGGDPDVPEAAQHLAPEPDLWEEPDPAAMPGQDITARQLLLGTAFHLVSEPGEEAGGPRLSAWGRVASSGFEGREDKLSLDGTVTTATLGVDGVWKRWLSGLLLAYSEGEGSFTHLDLPGGDVSSSLTSLHPYAAYTLSDRVRLWGTVGYGTGGLRLLLENQRAMDTDLTMTMGALGVRGSLLKPSSAGGLELALRSDVLWMVMDSAKADNLAATEAEASRLRLVLEGSRPVALAGGGSFTPSLEIGLRQDGGDAETGTGVEVGGNLRYASAWGLSIEASLRALVAHEEQDYREWGASGALRFDPGRQGRGLTASIVPTWGTASSGISRLWEQSTAAGLAPDSPMATAAAEGRLQAELGYGLVALKGRALLTPYARVALVESADQAWHLGTRLALAESLNLSVEASRRQREGDVAAHELALRANVGW